MFLPNESSVIILAAGNSGRMGFPKAFLSWDGKFTFLEKSIQTYRRFGCKEIVVVLNPQVLDFYRTNNYTFLSGVNVVINSHPEWERYYSIKTGLSALENMKACYIQDVDNPFTKKAILINLLQNLPVAGYSFPDYDEQGGHPLLISERIIRHIVHTKDNERNLREVLIQFDMKAVITDDPSVLYNINTPEDYERLIEGMPHDETVE